MNYEEFLSIVKNANPYTYWEQNKHRAILNFKVEDLEEGKLYVFTEGFSGRGETWFMYIKSLTPTDYGLYWTYTRKNKLHYMASHNREQGEKALKSRWDNHVWAHKDWVEFDFKKDYKFINWLRTDPLKEGKS